MVTELCDMDAVFSSLLD